MSLFDEVLLNIWTGALKDDLFGLLYLDIVTDIYGVFFIRFLTKRRDLLSLEFLLCSYLLSSTSLSSSIY